MGDFSKPFPDLPSEREKRWGADDMCFKDTSGGFGSAPESYTKNIITKIIKDDKEGGDGILAQLGEKNLPEVQYVRDFLQTGNNGTIRVIGRLYIVNGRKVYVGADETVNKYGEVVKIEVVKIDVDAILARLGVRNSESN